MQRNTLYSSGPWSPPLQKANCHGRTIAHTTKHTASAASGPIALLVTTHTRQHHHHTLQYWPLKSVTGSVKQPESSRGQGMPSPLAITPLDRHTR